MSDRTGRAPLALGADGLGPRRGYRRWPSSGHRGRQADGRHGAANLLHPVVARLGHLRNRDPPSPRLWVLVLGEIVSGTRSDRQLVHVQSLNMIAAAPRIGNRAGHRRRANLARVPMRGGWCSVCWGDTCAQWGSPHGHFHNAAG